MPQRPQSPWKPQTQMIMNMYFFVRAQIKYIVSLRVKLQIFSNNRERKFMLTGNVYPSYLWTMCYNLIECWIARPEPFNTNDNIRYYMFLRNKKFWSIKIRLKITASWSFLNKDFKVIQFFMANYMLIYWSKFGNFAYSKLSFKILICKET